MTASEILAGPAAGLDAGAAPALSRGRLFAAAMGLLLVNAAAGKAIEAVAASGVLGGLLDGLGHSWAFWFAFAATVGLALREQPQPVRPRDLWVCSAAALCALVPVSQVAGAACTGLAGAILIDRSQGPRVRAAAMILLAVSVQLVWSRIVMLFFVQPLATVDAHMVGALIGRPVHGHDVQFADGERMMSILGACTSVQNAATALMLFVAVVRCFRPVPRASEAFALAGVFLSVVALNVVRLALMAQSLAMFHLVNGGIGAGVVNAVITLTGLGWAVASVRHEIFDPR